MRVWVMQRHGQEVIMDDAGRAHSLEKKWCMLQALQRAMDWRLGGLRSMGYPKLGTAELNNNILCFYGAKKVNVMGIVLL